MWHTSHGNVHYRKYPSPQLSPAVRKGKGERKKREREGKKEWRSEQKSAWCFQLSAEHEHILLTPPASTHHAATHSHDGGWRRPTVSIFKSKGQSKPALPLAAQGWSQQNPKSRDLLGWLGSTATPKMPLLHQPPHCSNTSTNPSIPQDQFSCILSLANLGWVGHLRGACQPVGTAWLVCVKWQIPKKDTLHTCDPQHLI